MSTRTPGLDYSILFSGSETAVPIKQEPPSIYDTDPSRIVSSFTTRHPGGKPVNVDTITPVVPDHTQEDVIMAGEDAMDIDSARDMDLEDGGEPAAPVPNAVFSSNFPPLMRVVGSSPFTETVDQMTAAYNHSSLESTGGSSNNAQEPPEQAGIRVSDPRTYSSNEGLRKQAFSDMTRTFAARALFTDTSLKAKQGSFSDPIYRVEECLRNFSELTKSTSNATQRVRGFQSGPQQRGDESEKLPELPRGYLRDFLRAPHGQERACCYENNCMSYRLAVFVQNEMPEAKMNLAAHGDVFEPTEVPRQVPQQNTEGFVLRELLFPDEMAEWYQEQRWPVERRPCLLCCRMITQIAAVVHGSSLEMNHEICCVQNHMNLFNIVGEYSERVMLLSGDKFNGVIAPIVRYNQSDYVRGVTRVNDVDVPCWFEQDYMIFTSPDLETVLQQAVQEQPMPFRDDIAAEIANAGHDAFEW
jgi:hypothetical protein